MLSSGACGPHADCRMLASRLPPGITGVCRWAGRLPPVLCGAGPADGSATVVSHSTLQ